MCNCGYLIFELLIAKFMEIYNFLDTKKQQKLAIFKGNAVFKVYFLPQSLVGSKVFTSYQVKISKKA
jgi:hypothetical protein